jgi:hypothetical protein
MQHVVDKEAPQRRRLRCRHPVQHAAYERRRPLERARHVTRVAL